jgi:hypothetical protein
MTAKTTIPPTMSHGAIPSVPPMGIEGMVLAPIFPFKRLFPKALILTRVGEEAEGAEEAEAAFYVQENLVCFK